MEDLHQQLADNPQAAVTFAATEHANLQTERAATIGDADGRAQAPLAHRNNPVDAAVSTRQDRRQTQIGVSAA